MIRIVVTELSGEINGTIVDISDYNATNDKLMVYAYENNTYKPSEDGTFEGSVSSAEVDMDTGAFTLAFLGETTYDLVIAEYNSAGDFGSSVGVKEDIDVVNAEVVNVDINTSTL